MALPDSDKSRPAPPSRIGWLSGGGDRALSSRSLRRSRAVGLLKLVLPLLALVLVVMLIAWPQLYRRYEGFALTYSSLRLDDDALRMLNARYQGLDANGRPFVVTADVATQDPENRHRIALDRLQGDLTLADGTWLSLSADSGLFQEEQQILDLAGNVNFFSDRGYEFHAETARVDIGNGRVSSNQPVDGQGPFGLLSADRFWSPDKGTTVHFSGNVKVTLYPRSKGS